MGKIEQFDRAVLGATVGILRSRLAIGFGALLLGAGSASAVSFAVADEPEVTTTFFACETGAGKVRAGTIRTGTAPSCRMDRGEHVVSWVSTPNIDMLAGQPCNVGDPGEGTLSISYATGPGPVSLTCSPTSTRRLVVELTGNAGSSGVVDADGLALHCPETCAVDVPYGTAVALTASVPSDAIVFDGWTGCDPSGVDCNVLMTEDRVVRASFVEAFDLTVTLGGPGGVVAGLVDLGGEAYACPPTCTRAYAPNSSARVLAQSNNAATFREWRGCDVVDEFGACIVELTGDREVEAVFDLAPTQTLRIAATYNTCCDIREGLNSPPVALPRLVGPNGFECGFTSSYGIFGDNRGNPCPLEVPTLSQVTLELEGEIPEGVLWHGFRNCDVAMTETSCTFTALAPTGDELWGAHSSLPVQQIASKCSPANSCGGLIQSPSHGFTARSGWFYAYLGQTITLVALPDETSVFLRWEGSEAHPCDDQGATCTYPMGSSGASTVWAVFGPADG